MIGTFVGPAHRVSVGILGKPDRYPEPGTFGPLRLGN